MAEASHGVRLSPDAHSSSQKEGPSFNSFQQQKSVTTMTCSSASSRGFATAKSPAYTGNQRNGRRRSRLRSGTRSCMLWFLASSGRWCVTIFT